ncbi:MAG: VCBS repeat-containing protein [Saprospiraceae bacterium]|nr:VCBS repeat-containing protein [Saprospiraceae bacterium]
MFHNGYKFLLSFLVLILFSCNQDESIKSGSSDETGELFSLVNTNHSGIQFENKIIEDPERSYYVFNPIYNGGGVAIGDINNDGLDDIYFTGNEVPNKLYLNKGNLKFEDISKSAGVEGGEGWHNGTVMIDINCDGFLDIYVCRGGYVSSPELRQNLLFINQGDNTFIEAAAEYGVDDKGHSFHASFFDYDNDNDLDLYVINHPKESFLDIPDYLEGEKSGSWFHKDHLYKNENGKFTDVTFKAGIGKNYGFGLSLITADFNSDSFDDIYVANDYTQRDYLFLNQKDGTFKESLKSSMNHISLFAMGSDYADIDNDGLEDLFVSEMLPDDYKRSKTMMANMSTKRFESMVDNGLHYQYMHNSMQLNRGNGNYSEISQLTGTSKTDWSWACFLTDFDNDGLRDLFVSNGYRRDVYDKDSAIKRQQYLKDNNGKISDVDEFFKLTPSTKSTNFIFQNLGNYNFKKRIAEWGFTKASFSNGASISDLDNDGDIDIVTNNMEEAAFIYENNANNNSNNYIKIRLKGPKNNPQGLGAKVVLTLENRQQVFQQKMTRGYLSSVSPIVHFGIGSSKTIKNISVTWTDQTQTIIKDIASNQLVEIEYSNAVDANSEKASSPLLTEVTDQYFDQPVYHKENEHDDFKNQVLLPHKLSRLGPFVTVGDVNGDNLDDFYIGGAQNQAGQLYIQKANGKFRKQNVSDFNKDKEYEDMGSIFFDFDNDNDLDLYVVSGGTEKLINDPFYTDRLYTNNGKGFFTRSMKINDMRTSGSCVAAADYDLDGDIDLFVGGRTIPELYPNTPYCHLITNHENFLYDVTDQISPLIRKLGMITSAVWSDINNDKYPDLIVVGEWTPITILINKEGRTFEDATAQYGLDKTNGWWNKIIAEDLDNDGDSDFVVGNLGLNYKFHASKEKPFKVYSKDFDGNGSWDVMLTKYNGNQEVPVRGKQCTSEQMPFVNDKFPTYNAFAEASIDQIISTTANDVLTKEAFIFESIILRNDNGKLVIEPLPKKAQLSTINAIMSKDFNRNGKSDIIIGGNMFNSEVETTRADASYGLIIKDIAQQNFKIIESKDSGFSIPYDVKDMQAININGKEHILVTSNNDRLRCYVFN